MHKIFLLVLLALQLFSCAQYAEGQKIIDASQTESMLKSDLTVQLVDLRTPGELQATGKIEGAKTIDFNSPDFQTLIGQLDKEKSVIVYCASGGRSPRAAAQMTKMGFKKVYNYAGGMNDWKAKGKKTVNE